MSKLPTGRNEAGVLGIMICSAYGFSPQEGAVRSAEALPFGKGLRFTGRSTLNERV
jgi:hypothetical protein